MRNPSYRLNMISAVLLQAWLWHSITNKVWYAIKLNIQIKPKVQKILKSNFENLNGYDYNETLGNEWNFSVK